MVVVECGLMYDFSVVFYMEKLVIGFEVAEVVDIIVLVVENISCVVEVKNEIFEDVMVVIFDCLCY